MTITNAFTPKDWGGIRLVAFDVDGTLYRQSALRLRMARDISWQSVLKLDFGTIGVLAKYRRIRERLAEEEAVDFENVLIGKIAEATNKPPDTVRAIVSEWIERRPICYLARCRYAGVAELFEGLRSNGKVIGILSDYPAKMKLMALDLAANHIVTAGDAGVGLLKPHPRGLEFLMAMAGVEAHETVLIGDRPDRDGLAARRAGVRALIRSSKPIQGWQTFKSFTDPLFAPCLSR